MSLVNDVLSFVRKYEAPVRTWVYSFAGLVGVNATGELKSSVGTASLAAFGPAVVHLVHEVLSELKADKPAAPAAS